MRYTNLAALVALWLGLASAAPAALPASLKIEDDGRMRWGPVTASLLHFGPSWDSSGPGQITPDAGYPKRSDDEFELRGMLRTASGKDVRLTQVVRASEGDAVDVTIVLESAEPVATNSLSLSVDVPIDAIAGRNITADAESVLMPAELAEPQVFIKSGLNRVSIPTAMGNLVIGGPVDLFVQDNRPWGGDSFGFRLNFLPSSGELQTATFRSKMQLTPFVAKTLDLAAAANMGLVDEAAGDGQGGWTDQGAENDLRLLKPGDRTFGNVPMRVIDPSGNNGKAAIVLAGPDLPNMPKTASVPGGGSTDRWLYLLHAAAWHPTGGVGTLNATYEDGSTTSVEVVAGRDVGDWWSPVALPNGSVGFNAENPSSPIGLYVSRFPLSGKPLKSIDITSSGTGVWMVVAMSTSNDDIPLPTEAPLTITAGEDWVPVQSADMIEPGSVLDLSSLLDAPAGKHGRVVVRNGHFEFYQRPQNPVRFYGANLCFSANFPDHAAAERLAERVSRMGYNSIRLHHYDGDLVQGSENDSVTLNADQVDRIDYLIHCLKQKGIYINIDLYTFRQSQAHEIPEINRPSRDDYKALVYLLDSAFENWSTFARNVMTHRNQYTGLTWAEDPVFIGICPLNEDPMGVQWTSSDFVRSEVTRRFEAWLTQKNVAPTDATHRDRLMAEFQVELQNKGIERQFAFLKSLGVKAPLTSVNVVSAVSLTPVRDTLEYVDNHAYWDHPNFPERNWSLPHSYGNRSVLAASAEVPRAMMPTRIFGKPFTVTEINYCMPNQFRAEGGPVMGAYAALQDWDALWRFAFSHSRDNIAGPHPAAGFDVATDPLSLLSEQIAILMFLRGDVKAASKQVSFLVTPETAYTAPTGWGGDGFPRTYQDLGLSVQIGSHYRQLDADAPKMEAIVGRPGVEGAIPADDSLLAAMQDLGAIAKGAIDADTKRYRSDGDQIDLDGAAGSFKVVTPASECFVIPPGGQASGSAVNAKNNGATPAVVFVAAMDGLPVAESRKLMVMHLTDLQNTRIKYRSGGKRLMDGWGELPHLLRAGSVDLQMRFSTDGTAQAFGVELSGKRAEPVNVEADQRSVRLNATIAAGSANPRMVYEIVRP